MADPRDSSISGDGFRFYKWVDRLTGEETDVLSVTSIRTLAGEPFTLVNWKLANLADAALGTMKRTVTGPRGGQKDVRQVWEYPCEFARMYDDCAIEDEESPEEIKARQAKIDELRRWLRDAADEPRNIAAIRGTIVHEAIEADVDWTRIERPYVEEAFSNITGSNRKRAQQGVSDEDVFFIQNSVRNYWEMRAEVPMILLAQEVQVWNLTAGYAGTFDAMAWVLGEWVEVEGEDGLVFASLPDEAQAEVQGMDPRTVTVADIKRIGGTIVLLDWKTATDIHTDNVIQATAYMSAEFVGNDGLIDQRMTDLLHASMVGGLVHVRPNKWGLHLFQWEPEIVRAFLGACAFARFLAKYRKPNELFFEELQGGGVDAG